MKKLIFTILIIINSTYVFSQIDYKNQSFNIGIESINEFRDFLLIKNDANYKSEMEPLIKWGIDNFKKYGFEVERLETPELPLLLASKIISEKAKTILIYLQFDGQPVDNSKWEQQDPYRAVLKEKINEKYEIVNWEILKGISMKDILDLQKQNFIENGHPSLEQRLDRLKRCVALIETHDDQIIESLNADYKMRSKYEIITSEISQTLRTLNFSIKNTKKWMKAIKRPSEYGAGFLGAKSYMIPSPLGSVGVIAPWNFPVGMVFYPTASILAAGNTVMAKPSEFTPNTSQLIKDAVEKYFDKSEFAIFLGGPEIGEEFSKLPFDHLLYTGSGRIAKKVLSQTAENIVPTTMELGGKSPTIISDDADLKLAAKRILFVKTLNNGQICLSPDYIFIKKGLENDFVDALKSVFAEFFPTADGEDTYTSMVNKDHYERMKLYLNDAQAKGASVIELGNFDNQEINLMGTKVILNVNDDMEVMKNEVFGPLLPLMTFEKLDEVTNYINSHDHPLGLYFFGNKKAEQDFVINNTKSGGVTINDVMFHLAQSHLPFGGVGPSGYGHYHGYEGFLNFSNLRAVYYQSKFDKIFEAMRPPRGKSFKAFLDLMKRIS